MHFPHWNLFCLDVLEEYTMLPKVLDNSSLPIKELSNISFLQTLITVEITKVLGVPLAS